MKLNRYAILVGTKLNDEGTAKTHEVIDSGAAGPMETRYRTEKFEGYDSVTLVTAPRGRTRSAGHLPGVFTLRRPAPVSENTSENTPKDDEASGDKTEGTETVFDSPFIPDELPSDYGELKQLAISLGIVLPGNASRKQLTEAIEELRGDVAD